MSGEEHQGELGPELAGEQFHTIAADDNDIRLDRWFKRHLPDVPFALVSRWARTGQIRLDGARVDVSDRIAAGQTLRVPPPPPPETSAGALVGARRAPRVRKPLTPEQEALARSLVIHEDRAALVLNKPAGLATQGGTKTFDHVDGLMEAFADDKGNRPKLVHRLDKDTSGVLLLAKTPGSAAHFSKQFSGRRTKKIYWALVMGIPDINDGIIELPLAKQPGSGGEKMHVDEENGQPAKSRYRVIERAGNRTAWVELQPYTGRTHQLRVHMAAIGHPIVGDGKYGGRDAFLTGAISRKMHLHARRLKIPHPDGGSVEFTAELPDHFAESMEQLGFDMARGEALTDDTPPPPPGKAAQKQKAKAHAKGLRKERKGERRSRGAEPELKKAASKKPAPKKPAAKAGAKVGAKPAPRKAAPRFAAPKKPR